MEARYGSVTVTLTNGLLMCACEVLTTLLVSALFKAQLLAQGFIVHHTTLKLINSRFQTPHTQTYKKKGELLRSVTNVIEHLRDIEM
ncbi:hypothetical protein OIU76_002604 [Salix suchowensis]|nr:hypothetical protein OIU76_002604 [Salix suchowensis]KAJ6353615.1 hypothetical protein OIU76_002604 [Salix suchowensis]